MDHLHAYHRAPFHARGEIGGLLVRSALDFVSRGGYVVSAFTGQTSPSSRGLGHHPFKVATRVRIPLGTPNSKKAPETLCFWGFWYLASNPFVPGICTRFLYPVLIAASVDLPVLSVDLPRGDKNRPPTEYILEDGPDKF